MNEPTPKRRRRWYQFSLRMLILLVLICAIPAAWFGWKFEETRREQVAVAEIVKMGGDIHFYLTIEDWGTVRYVRIEGPQVTDTGLVHLKDSTNLKGLDIWDAKVTDAGLVHLKGLGNLKSLQLENTEVTDAGLVNLEGLCNLKSLVLVDTKVTDEGVKKLQQALPYCRVGRR